jgi:hypothetical protein
MSRTRVASFCGAAPSKRRHSALDAWRRCLQRAVAGPLLAAFPVCARWSILAKSPSLTAILSQRWHGAAGGAAPAARRRRVLERRRRRRRLLPLRAGCVARPCGGRQARRAALGAGRTHGGPLPAHARAAGLAGRRTGQLPRVALLGSGGGALCHPVHPAAPARHRGAAPAGLICSRSPRGRRRRRSLGAR